MSLGAVSAPAIVGVFLFDVALHGPIVSFRF
jgi:hypothetical protein